MILLNYSKTITACYCHINIQTLLIEVFKMKITLTPPIMESVVKRRTNTYNLRNLNFWQFVTERKKKAFVWSGNSQLQISSSLVSFLIDR